jgi:ABC-type branched-subunit amino acid transport system ATPase component
MNRRWYPASNLVGDVLEKIAEINRETGVSILIVEQKVREVLAISRKVYSLSAVAANAAMAESAKLGKVFFEGKPEESTFVP